MTITNQKLRSKGKKDPISPTIYSPPSSLAPPLMTLSRKQETKKTQALHVSPPRKTSSLYSAPAPLASPVPQTPVSNLDEDNDNDGIVDDNVPFVVPSLAPPPTTPSRFSRVLDDTTIFGSPFEVKYSPKETAIEDLQSRLSSRKDSKHHDQLLGEALFPKSLNAHEVESIVSLERSRSMRSFKSNKRNSFINYDGSNENIIQGDSSISLSSPGRQSTDINRSTSILKNSDSRRSLQIDTVMRAPTINDKNSKRNSKKVDETDKYSFEEGHNYDDFIEFQDFIDVENLDFSPQLSYAPSFSTSFDGDIESVPQTSTPIATPLISIVRGGEDVLRLKEVSAPVQEQEVTPVSAMAPISTPVPRLITPTTPSPIFAATPTSPISPVARSSSSIKSIPSPIKSSRIQLPKKISKDSFTKEIKEIPISKSKELPSLNTNTLEEVDEQPINAPLTPNLEKIETIPPISPSIHLESTNHYQSPSPVTSNVNSQAISRNIPEVNAQGKSNYNNRPISMSFKGLNGPSFQGKLQMQNIRSSSSHQSFNISFADSSDVGSSTGVMDSEFDDEDEDDDNDFGSGVGNGFGSDDDDDEDDIAAYSNRHIPNFVQPPSFHNGKMRSNNSSPRSAYNGHQQSPSQSSITSSPRSLGSLISRTWKKQGQLGMSVPPKQHTAVMPVQIRNGVRFSSRIVLYDTYNGDEYDRHPDTATCNQLTPMLAQQIKDELNVLKLNWYIHEQSRCYTHFM